MTTSVNLDSSKREALKSHLRDSLDASHVNRVLADPEVSLSEMQGLSADEKGKFRQAIQAKKSEIGETTANNLEALLQEAERSVSAKPIEKKQEAPKEVTTPPSDVGEAGVKALDAVRSALEPSGKPPAEYLSEWRRFKAQIPGMEVGGLSEISDVLNQSRQYNKELINYLVKEATKPDLSLTFNAWPFSGRPGVYPSFIDDKFSSVEEKQRAITNALNNIEQVWRNQGADASGMGVWGWAITAIGLFLGYKVIWNGGKFVASKIKWFGVGSAIVGAMDAVGGVAKERADQAKTVLDEAKKQREAALKARGIIDPTSSDFKELFDVGEKTIRQDGTISDAEKARRIRALSTLQGRYIAEYNAGKITQKYVGNGIRAEVGYLVTGNFGAGNIDARAGQGTLTKGGTMVTETARNAARNMPGIGRFFQGGLVGALNTADNLKTGASLDPLPILGESIEFKDAQTRNHIETIWDLSKQRAKLLRIQEKLTEFSTQDTLVRDLNTQLQNIPQKVELQTEISQPIVAQNQGVVMQQQGVQIMTKQEINPEHTEKLKELNKARNRLIQLTNEARAINPKGLTLQAIGVSIDGIETNIESKITDLRASYPNAQVPEYDRNNKGVNFEKWVLRLAKIFKKK